MNSEATGNDPMSNYLDHLRQLVGEAGAEDFSQFQQHIFSQSSELRVVKRTCEQLREALNKSQEERQDLELRLVAEKAHRDQEAKNALTTIERNSIQLNAQVYSMKCEVETWKQKAEATSKESQLLKEQLKAVQLEKLEAGRKQSELTEKVSGFENFQKQFEFYSKRIRDTIEDLTRQLNQCKAGGHELGKLLEDYKKEVNVMNVHVKAQNDNGSFYEKMNRELEQELVKSKAESKQLRQKVVQGSTQEALQHTEIRQLEQRIEKMEEIKQEEGKTIQHITTLISDISEQKSKLSAKVQLVSELVQKQIEGSDTTNFICSEVKEAHNAIA